MAEGVERFKPAAYADAAMEPAEKGMWVRHRDFVTLAASKGVWEDRAHELEAQRDAALTALEELAGEFETRSYEMRDLRLYRQESVYAEASALARKRIVDLKGEGGG